MCTRALPLALLLLGATGCPTGKPIPDETPLRKIPGGTFTLGPNRPDGMPTACDYTQQTEIKRCDCGRQDFDPLGWIDDLTWVPAATATVATFTLDEYEVTNAQYLYCVEMGVCTPPAETAVNGTPYYDAPDFETAPVVHVTHEQAKRYCAFVGKLLPTEAQWERAARLGAGGAMNTYPWPGEEPTNCNSGSARFALAKGCRDTPQPADYSSADVTATGLRNMASNVSEWVRDGWNRYAYCEGGKGYDSGCQTTGATCPSCVADGAACAKSCDPSRLVICKAGSYAAAPDGGNEWVVRGGSWNHGLCYNRLYVRRKDSQARAEIGFRCARE
ncbi:MAG: formylglycine-generating enzyme family protein [Acidobacteriota bacterium]